MGLSNGDSPGVQDCLALADQCQLLALQHKLQQAAALSPEVAAAPVPGSGPGTDEAAPDADPDTSAPEGEAEGGKAPEEQDADMASEATPEGAPADGSSCPAAAQAADLAAEGAQVAKQAGFAEADAGRYVAYAAELQAEVGRMLDAATARVLQVGAHACGWCTERSARPWSAAAWLPACARPRPFAGSLARS